MFNTVILSGRLTADPELKKTLNGISVTSFTIAVDRPYKSGEDKKTDFISIVAWRGTAEFITHYFTKGSLIGIEGSIQTRKYEDKDGKSRTVFEVVANNAQFIMPKSSAEKAFNEDNGNVSYNAENGAEESADGFVDVDISSSDLPF